MPSLSPPLPPTAVPNRPLHHSDEMVMSRGNRSDTDELSSVITQVVEAGKLRPHHTYHRLPRTSVLVVFDRSAVPTVMAPLRKRDGGTWPLYSSVSSYPSELCRRARPATSRSLMLSYPSLPLAPRCPTRRFVLPADR